MKQIEIIVLYRKIIMVIKNQTPSTLVFLLRVEIKAVVNNFWQDE